MGYTAVNVPLNLHDILLVSNLSCWAFTSVPRTCQLQYIAEACSSSFQLVVGLHTQGDGI